MHRETQRCTAASLKAVELLRHEGACVQDVAQSNDGYSSSSSAYHHFISMLPVQTEVAQQDKHRGRKIRTQQCEPFDSHTSRPSTHTSWWAGIGREEETEKSLLAAVCLLKKNRYGRVVLCCVTSESRAETACESYVGKCMCTCWILCCF